MTTAADCLRASDPQGALILLQDQIRADAANAKHRIFLFQLLSVLGQWDRALTQLNVVGELDDGALAMVQAYREALQCEALRAEVFAGRRQPLVFGQPEEWIALLLESLKLLTSGKVADAQALRAAAFEAAPATAGKIVVADPTGESEESKGVETEFAWIADADSRLGPILEVVVNGKYYWVPFQHIRKVEIAAPEDLRDLVWTPAQFTWQNGGQAVGMIPTRYPGSVESGDGALLMARRTDWQSSTQAGAEDEFAGLGQRLLSTDQGEYGLLDVRGLEFAAVPQPDTGAGGDESAGDGSSDHGPAGQA